jgi:hypothetical protein
MQFLPTFLIRGATRTAIGACLFVFGAQASFAQTAAPDWAAGIAPGTWQAISLNQLEDVDPSKDSGLNRNYPDAPPWNGASGQRAVITAWNGGAFAPTLGTKGSLLLHGGGHKDYFGSEVYAFDMSTRRWSRISNPYTGSMSWPQSDGSFPDGSPSIAHTYDMLEFDPGSNAFVTLSAQSNDAAYRVNVAHTLSLADRKWSHSTINSSVAVPGGGYSAYDTKRGVIWLEGGSSSTALVQYDARVRNSDGTVGKWTNFPAKIRRTDSVGAYDPVHDILVVTGFRDGDNVYGIDLNNLDASAVTLNEVGTAPAKSSAHGWEWSSTRGAFLYWRSGADVYEFRPPSGNWQTGQWTWSKLTSGSNSVTPNSASSDNGVYGRFRIARYADQEIAVVVNGVSSSVYAFRIPTGIAPRAPTNVTAE